jgi:hypothetical protein
MLKTDFVLPRKHSKCLHIRPIGVVQENNRLLGESVKHINVLCGRRESSEL